MADETPVTNSYIETVEEADAYFAERLYSDEWDNADSTDQIKALQQATRKIDTMFFLGQKYDIDYTDGVANQPRAFPRYDPNNGFTYDYDYSNDGAKVPQKVKDACCEEALALLKFGNSPRLEYQQQGISEIQVGKGSGFREVYKPGAGKGLLSQEAKEYLQEYIVTTVTNLFR